MKKIIYIVAVLMVILTSTVLAQTTSKEEVLHYMGVELFIDQQRVIPMDVNHKVVNPFSINGTTYLPVRAIAEALGKSVDWDGETSSVLITDSETPKVQESAQEVEKYISDDTKTLHYRDIKLYINQQLVVPKDVNGNVVEPFLIEGTTYLPVRAVSEALGKVVEWDGENKRVLISSQNGEDANAITSAQESSLVAIKDVVVKVLDETLTTEITTSGPLQSYHYFALDDPDRLVIDLDNTYFDMDTKTQRINYDVIEQIRFGIQDNDVCRVVLDVKGLDKLTYTVVQNNGKDLTYLALNENFKLAEQQAGNDTRVASNDNKLYLPTPEGQVISGETNLNEPEANAPSLGTTSGETESVPQDDTSGTQETEASEVNEKQENTQEPEITKEENPKDAKEELYIVEEDLAVISAIKYSSNTDLTKVMITGDYDYEAFTLTNPNRVVVDIKNAKLDYDGPEVLTPKNKNVTAIRFSQYEKDIVRIVYEVSSLVDYQITDKANYLQIELYEPSYRNISYKAYSDYAELTLSQVKKNVFNTTEEDNILTLSYSSSFDPGYGKIAPDDEFVKSIRIKSSSIVVTYAASMAYSLKQEGSDVVVTIKPSSKTEVSSDKPSNTSNKDEFVVLVDAGHGGNDPGACNGEYYEKIYNLAIAKKVYEKVNQTDGMRAYIDRKDNDTYMEGQDRLDFILSHTGEADLFVSVHNNAAKSKDANGTMVLYYNKPCEEAFGITSKEFAQIVVNKLSSTLGTKNLGVVERSDLWVLARSNLPSILCEVVFISNDKEVQRLIDEDFQDEAAEAIYNGILAAKKQMGR